MIVWYAAYVLSISVLAFILFGADKFRARRKKRRIPERQLLLVCLAGGSAGALFGMFLFHHKTRHSLFYLGVPAILLFQLFLVLVFWDGMIQV